MSSLSSAPHHVELKTTTIVTRFSFLGSSTKQDTTSNRTQSTMTAHLTFQLGTYRLAAKNQPAGRPCALARIPSAREDARRSDTWMPSMIGAGCGDGRSSA